MAAFAVWLAPAISMAQPAAEADSPHAEAADSTTAVDAPDPADTPPVADTPELNADTPDANADSHAKPSQAKLAAEALFQEALDLRDQGQWKLACDKFLSSHELSPARGTLLNIAECHERFGYIASAWGAYRELEDLAQAANDTERLVIALRKTRELGPRLPHMTIRIAGAADIVGLRVTLDGMPVDAALMGVSLPVDPGEHVIEATAANHEPWSQRVTLAESEAAELTVPRLTASMTGPAGSAAGAIGAVPAVTAAQPAEVELAQRNFNVKLNPIGLMTGTGGLELEIRAGESVSFSPTFTYSEAGNQTSVLGLGARLNFYLKKRVLAGGVIISPFASFAKLTFMGDETSAIVLGGIAGHQWMWPNGFNIGAGGGLVYYALLDSDDPDFAFSGVGLAAELTLGYAF